jgi:CRP/FNR family transcriptional regulator, nitrogen oxide reductase regulator
MKPNDLKILKQSSIFAALEDNELQELAALAVERRLVAGESIFWEGDASDWFYIIAAGQVKVTKISSLGKETIIAFFGPGEMFGEVAVFENKPYPASSQSLVETRLLSIRKEAFIKFLTSHPPVTLRIINILSSRLREAQNRLRDLAGERVEQRLARMLLMLADKIGRTLPFTRQEVSDMSGTTTETTIRILSQWKERGIISSVRGKITLIDEPKLKLLAEGPPTV